MIHCYKIHWQISRPKIEFWKVSQPNNQSHKGALWSFPGVGNSAFKFVGKTTVAAHRLGVQNEATIAQLQEGPIIPPDSPADRARK